MDDKSKTNNNTETVRLGFFMFHLFFLLLDPFIQVEQYSVRLGSGLQLVKGRIFRRTDQQLTLEQVAQNPIGLLFAWYDKAPMIKVTKMEGDQAEPRYERRPAGHARRKQRSRVFICRVAFHSGYNTTPG